MTSDLFNIKFPDVKEDITFETFKTECLKLQKSEPFRTKWFRHVDERYLIPLLTDNEKNLEILVSSVENFEPFRRRCIRIHKSDLKKDLPFHLGGFIAFEEIEKRFPALIDINLRRIFNEKYKIFEEKKEKEVQTVKLFKMLENNEANIRVSFHAGDDDDIFVGTMIPDDYVFSPKTQTLSVYFFRDINLGPSAAVKLFGSKVTSRGYGRRRTKTYQVLPQWDEEHKKRFTLRRNTKNNKTYREVLGHDEDDPLIIRFNYCKAALRGSTQCSIFSASVPVYKINDKTGDIVDQLYKVKARISTQSILNPQKKKKRSKTKDTAKNRIKIIPHEESDVELSEHKSQEFKEQNIGDIQVPSPPPDVLSDSSISFHDDVKSVHSWCMGQGDRLRRPLDPPPVSFAEV